MNYRALFQAWNIANRYCCMHVSSMNSTPALKQSYPYEPPIRDENNFLWIETLVCDFLHWTLGAHPTHSAANMHMIARLFGEVWRHQFSQPTSLCAGAASLQSLLALSVKSG